MKRFEDISLHFPRKKSQEACTNQVSVRSVQYYFQNSSFLYGIILVFACILSAYFLSFPQNIQANMFIEKSYIKDPDIEAWLQEMGIENNYKFIEEEKVSNIKIECNIENKAACMFDNAYLQMREKKSGEKVFEIVSMYQ